jgi:hypothetical protein
VQNGWVRGNERKLDPEKSTPLEPVLSLRASDVSPLPADRFTEVTIPLYYEGHVYRAGSRIRVTISAPNGTQPIWAFAHAQPEGAAEVAVAHGEDMPSHLLLPVVPGVDVTTALPPCPGLRGEPCRGYVPFANRSVDPRSPAEPPAQGGDSTNHAAGRDSTQQGKNASKCGKRHHRKRRHGKHRHHKQSQLDRRHGKHRHKHGRCHRKRHHAARR